MILAAGKGTRLAPLTATVPKPLIEVAGRPMIAFPLELLRRAGIHEVVINLHHLGEQIRVALGDGHALGVRITYSQEDPILDTGGAIAAAHDFLRGDSFAVLNADTYIDLDLCEVIAFHRAHNATATMVVRPDPQALRKDRIALDASLRMRRIFGQAPSRAPASAAAELPTPYMYAGVLVFAPRVFSYLLPGIYSITRDVYPQLLEAGEPLYGYVHHGYWRVLDTPEDLAAGRREIADRIAQRPLAER